MSWSLTGHFVLLAVCALVGSDVTNSALAYTSESSPQIIVRVYDYATVSPETLTSVKNGASLIFQQAGIDTSWLDCRRALSNSPVPQQCQEPSGPTDVVLRIVLEPKSDGC